MSFNTLIDVNKYLYNTNNTDDTIGFNNNNDKMRDINLIEIYIINTNKGKYDNIIDVSLSSKNNLESFIDNYYKKSRVEKYKSYTHKERVYTYELSNDNQYVSSNVNNKDIKTLYIEYRHSNNVDTDKINDTINKIIKKILSQSK